MDRVEYWRGNRATFECLSVMPLLIDHGCYSVSSTLSKILYLGLSHSTASSSNTSQLGMNPSLIICYRLHLTLRLPIEVLRLDLCFKKVVLLTSWSHLLSREDILSIFFPEGKGSLTPSAASALLFPVFLLGGSVCHSVAHVGLIARKNFFCFSAGSVREDPLQSSHSFLELLLYLL
jgi:hypothetical protein